MLIKQRVAWAPNFIRRFGFFHGVRLLVSIEKDLSSNKKRVKSYKVPGYEAPFYLRDTVADHAIFKQCVVNEQYDFRKFPQSERLLKEYHSAISNGEQPLIIDCGGNVGLATRWFAKCFPEAQIVSVEPDIENFRLLTMNTESLGDRVVRLHGGVWNRPAKLKIINPESGSAAFRVDELDVSSPDGLRAYTIDEICALQGRRSPFIVKIDIEGAQSVLFMDSPEWVSQTHLITLELDDWLMPWKGTSRSFFRCVSCYPFDYLLGGESIFCFRDFSETVR